MEYQIESTSTARREIHEAIIWKRQRSASGTARWYRGLQKAIASLSHMPLRCGRAAESDMFEEEIHELLYGRRPQVYRILFSIHDDVVRILHVRHAARGFLEPGE